MTYYVIKKNVNGEYLLSNKNEIITQSWDYASCIISFVDALVNRTSKSDVYVLCKKISDEKYIQIMCER